MRFLKQALDFKTQYSFKHAFFIFFGYAVAGMLLTIVARYLIVTWGFPCVTKIDGRNIGVACPYYRHFWYYFLLVFFQIFITVWAARNKLSGNLYFPMILGVIVLGGVIGFALQMPVVILLSSLKLASSKVASHFLFLAPALVGLLPFLYLLTRPPKQVL